MREFLHDNCRKKNIFPIFFRGGGSAPMSPTPVLETKEKNAKGERKATRCLTAGDIISNTLHYT